LDAYKLESGHYLIALDGSQYFSSQKIHCPHCLTCKGTKGATRYSHQILQAVMINPHLRQVLPLAPEPVANTDGTTKQDCEINAAKRIETFENLVTSPILYFRKVFSENFSDCG
jgi:hypothetical protein